MPQLARSKSQLKKANATTQNALAATKPPRSQLAHPSHHPTPTRPSHHSLNMPNSTIPSDRKTLLQILSQNACFRHVIRHAALRTLGPSSRAISLSLSLPPHAVDWAGPSVISLISLFLSLSLLSLSLTLTLTLTRTLTLTLTHARTHTHAHTRAHTHTLSLSLSLSPAAGRTASRNSPPAPLLRPQGPIRVTSTSTS